LTGTTSTSSGTRKAKKIRWTNFAAVAMETKKGGFKNILDHFEMAPILKILKTKSTTLTDEFFQPLKSCHTLRWIFLQSFMKIDEWNPKMF
jgi:hypothetical protein